MKITMLLVWVFFGSSALAGEKFEVKYETSLAECTIGVSGEVCKEATRSYHEGVIELKALGAHQQIGVAGVGEPTELGYFAFHVTTEKIGKDYSLFIKFIEPNYREYFSRSISFTPSLGLPASPFRGSPVILYNNRYLLPLIDVLELKKLN